LSNSSADAVPGLLGRESAFTVAQPGQNRDAGAGHSSQQERKRLLQCAMKLYPLAGFCLLADRFGGPAAV